MASHDDMMKSIQDGDFCRSDMLDIRDLAILAKQSGDSTRASELREQYNAMLKMYEQNPSAFSI